MLYVKNLRKSYQSGNKSYSVLKGIDLSVANQEFVAVMGPSGSGKSTLLNCISCYIPFEEGTISLGGQNLKGLEEDALAKIRNEKLGFVFQDFNLLDTLTVSENIALALTINHTPAEQVDAKVLEIAQTLSITDILDKYPYQVSGGQKQRAALARALFANPRILLLDEPFSALDPLLRKKMRGEILGWLKTLSSPAIIITHDPDDVDAFAGMLALFWQGKTRLINNYPELRKNFATAADCILSLQKKWVEKI